MRALTISLLLVSLMQGEAHAQGERHWPEFTREEFYEALRRVMPEERARQMSQELTLGSRATYEQLGIPREMRPASRPVSAVGFISDDVLILLSLVSDDTRVKVEQFRLAAHNGKPFSAEEQRAWNERLAQFRKWKDAGYPN